MPSNKILFFPFGLLVLLAIRKIIELLGVGGTYNKKGGIYTRITFNLEINVEFQGLKSLEELFYFFERMINTLEKPEGI